MLVVNRFRADDETESVADGAGDLGERLAGALDLLADQAGYVDGVVGRNVDDPTLWVLQTRWRDVGSYRRALSVYDVKLSVVPLLSRSLDEPSAYEIAHPGAAAPLNRSVPRHLG